MRAVPRPRVRARAFGACGAVNTKRQAVVAVPGIAVVIGFVRVVLAVFFAVWHTDCVVTGQSERDLLLREARDLRHRRVVVSIGLVRVVGEDLPHAPRSDFKRARFPDNNRCGGWNQSPVS